MTSNLFDANPAANAANHLQSVQRVLREVWGYDSFRPFQQQSIQCVLQKRDSLTVLPTGGGKSLCFQVPALCAPGIAVIVSPLISLMKDQVDALKACGVAAAFVNSTQSVKEKRDVADQIRKGRLKLLYVAPERLLVDKTIEFLRECTVSFFAVDEAHCISNWGHDFRPEYRGLRVLKQHFPGISIHAYTATASDHVRRDIVEQLGLNNAEILVGDFDRPNLVYRMMRSINRIQQVIEVIRRHPGESGIVYCISRKEVDRTAQLLNQIGCSALPYHAGMTDADRKSNQDAFIKEKCDIIVATIAFGMGIDKSNVRYVIHAGMPKSIEHYQQESGRAGRDGLESECVLIYSGGDVIMWKKIMEGGDREAYAGAVRALESLNDICGGTVCRHKSLVEYFGQSYLQDNCGACDVCLDELELVDDPITLSQKILSCVLRLEERFGAAHTVKVLIGAMDAGVLQRGHEKLSTFGLLSNEGSAAVRMWIDQLIQQGFLLKTGEYQILSLSPLGKRLIRRDGNPRLTVPANSFISRHRPVAVDAWDGVDRGLFDELRQLRSNIATELNVPAFVVFGDASLREFARQRPGSLERFSRIKGVGEQKLGQFGGKFIAAINRYCTQRNLDLNVNVTAIAVPAATPKLTFPNASALTAFAYFRQGESIESVAKKMSRATSTVNGYLQSYIREDKITDASPWVGLATQQRILSNLHRMEEGRMQPLHEFFNGEVSFNEIRITIQCHRNTEQKAE